MKLTTNGLVIWETKTGDTDRIITLLTPEGCVTAFAKGSRRPGGRLTSATAMFTYGQFELFKGRNMYTVDSAAAEHQFVALAADVRSMSLATYLCELLRRLSPIEEDGSDFLSLAMTSLYYLNSGKNPQIIKPAFELKLMSLAGYMPRTDCCRECSSPAGSALYFDPVQGDWLCESCALSLGQRLNCSGAVMAAMKYITEADAKKVFSFSLPEKQMENLVKTAEAFVEHQLEERPSTLDFYNLIKND